MSDNPLLTDDLATLLSQFPNEALQGLRAILAGGRSYRPLPSKRAEAVHALPEDADLRQHAAEIAREITWWGSHEVVSRVRGEPSWRSLVAFVAQKRGVKEEERDPDILPAWRLEGALLRKCLADWDRLTPAEREETIRKAGYDRGAMPGGLSAATVAALRAGGPQVLKLLAGRGGALITSGPAALVVAGLSAGWMAYNLLGPSLRVLQPATLTVAITRLQLREAAMTGAFAE